MHHQNKPTGRPPRPNPQARPPTPARQRPTAEAAPHNPPGEATSPTAQPQIHQSPHVSPPHHSKHHALPLPTTQQPARRNLRARVPPPQTRPRRRPRHLPLAPLRSAPLLVRRAPAPHVDPHAAAHRQCPLAHLPAAQHVGRQRHPGPAAPARFQGPRPPLLSRHGDSHQVGQRQDLQPPHPARGARAAAPLSPHPPRTRGHSALRPPAAAPRADAAAPLLRFSSLLSPRSALCFPPPLSLRPTPPAPPPTCSPPTPPPRPTSPAPHPIPSRAFSKPTGASTNARTAVPTALTSPPLPSAARTAPAVFPAAPH